MKEHASTSNLRSGSRSHWLVDSNQAPTRETPTIESLFPDPKVIPLKDYDLDHVLGELVRNEAGRAVVTLKGKAHQLDVVLGQNYPALVIGGRGQRLTRVRAAGSRAAAGAPSASSRWSASRMQ
jgi:hypothetical protein